MTDDMSDDDRLFEEAFDLIIRLQNDPASPVARDLAGRWRARSSRHETAWAEAVEIHGMAGKVLDERRGTQDRPVLSRRAVVLGGVAGVAALGVGATLGPQFLLGLRADYLTATAERRRVDLPDGTVVTLGPESAIRKAFVPSVRRVELLAGMAFFEVAPDARRPFEVAAGAVTATALGTAFDLSMDADFLTLAVDAGEVRVQRPDSPLAQGQTLPRGGWLTFNEQTLGVESGVRDADSIGAWREGMIVADREPIAAVVARIARWQPGRVLIIDPGFGDRRISGVFDLGNPLAALEAVAQPHGGRVRQLSRWLTLISPV